MFLVDNILLSPVRGIVWVSREIANAAQQELVDQAESITTELSELYMMLETGRITEAEFDAQEGELLDRLDEVQGDGTVAANEEKDGDNGRWHIYNSEHDRAGLLAETVSASPPVRG